MSLAIDPGLDFCQLHVDIVRCACDIGKKKMVSTLSLRVIRRCKWKLLHQWMLPVTFCKLFIEYHSCETWQYLDLSHFGL